jgi:hypothetical protein
MFGVVVFGLMLMVDAIQKCYVSTGTATLLEKFGVIVCVY